jgi:glycosyltransferase involved in cell wall biosynthesis
MHRLALVTSHPIQYQVPWFRALAQVTDLEVFYCHRQNSEDQAAAGFDVPFQWDIPLFDGYAYSFLQNVASRPDVSSFSGCDTPEIADRLRAGRFDACLVSGWYLKSYLQAIWACQHAGIPVLTRGDSQLGTPRSKLFTVAKYLPYRWLLRSIDAHLYVGRANREYLTHYGVRESSLFFSPHFVDNAFFETRSATARADGQAALVRQDLGIPADAIVFAFAGKLIERKRPADILRALAIARTQNVKLWLLIIGSGPLQLELDQLAADLNIPVTFAGFQNQTELPRHFAAADALILASDARETWGLVVNEAMACGLPAIVSTAAGCARDLVDEMTGIQFPVGDIAALATAMSTLADTLSVRGVEIRRAVHSKIDQYSCEAAVRGTLEALDAVARPTAVADRDSLAAMGRRAG